MYSPRSLPVISANLDAHLARAPQLEMAENGRPLSRT